MEKIYGNVLGICVNNNDPEKRGRVQIFIPHIMPALYDGWNKDGKDIDITCVGSNLANSLTEEQITKLQQILPWAESASPICGSSAPGNLITTAGKVAAGLASGFVTGGIPGAISGGIKAYYDQSPVSSPIVAGNQDDSALFAKAAGYGSVSQNEFASNSSSSGKCGVGSRSMLGALTNNSYFSQGISSGSGGSDEARSLTIGGGNNYLSKATTSGGQPLFNAPQAGLGSLPSNPAIGTTVAASGGHKGQGHIQVWTGSRWVSNFSQNPDGKSVIPGTGGILGSSGGVAYDNFTVYIPTEAGAAAMGNAPGATTAQSPTERTSMSGEQAAPASQSDPTGPIVPVEPNNPASGGPPPNIINTVPSIASNSTNLGISPNDVKPVGDAQTRTVSTYGGVTSDLTTYLDVAPSQRPADATAYWQNKGVNIADQESKLQSRGIKTGTLNLSDTTQGKYVGNLIPGFDIGVPANNAYGLKGGSMVYIADKNGNPVGTNGGYFRVADTGSSTALTGQSSSGAIDFYAGNDPSLTNYFTGLNSNGTNISVQPVDVTGDSANALKDFISTNNSNANIASAAPGSQSTSLVNRPNPHGAMPIQNLNNTAKGLFSYPAAGAMLWVFFREGNPLYPVYFAASYSSDEWKSAYRQGSNTTGYSDGENGVFSTGGIMNLGGVGGLSWSNTHSPTDPSKAQQNMMFFGEDGSNMFMGNGYHQIFSKFDRRDQVEGDRWNTTLGYKEDWVQGDHNHVTMGDVYVKIGNVSQPAVDAVTRIQQLIKDGHKPLTDLK